MQKQNAAEPRMCKKHSRPMDLVVIRRRICPLCMRGDKTTKAQRQSAMNASIAAAKKRRELATLKKQQPRKRGSAKAEGSATRKDALSGL